MHAAEIDRVIPAGRQALGKIADHRCRALVDRHAAGAGAPFAGDPRPLAGCGTSSRRLRPPGQRRHPFLVHRAQVAGGGVHLGTGPRLGDLRGRAGRVGIVARHGIGTRERRCLLLGLKAAIAETDRAQDGEGHPSIGGGRRRACLICHAWGIARRIAAAAALQRHAAALHPPVPAEHPANRLRAAIGEGQGIRVFPPVLAAIGMSRDPDAQLLRFDPVQQRPERAQRVPRRIDGLVPIGLEPDRRHLRTGAAAGVVQLA